MNNYSECPLSYGLMVKELELLTLNPPSGTARYKRAMQSNPAQEEKDFMMLVIPNAKKSLDKIFFLLNRSVELNVDISQQHFLILND